MANIVYLEPGEAPPDVGDDTPWMHVEANERGLFYGTGASWKPTGERVGYVSLPESDVTLEKALAAALEWAEKYAVPTIWVQRERWKPD